MVKIDKNIVEEKPFIPKKPSLFTRFVVTLLLMLGVFVVAAAITYLGTFLKSGRLNNYSTCIKSKGSTIEETYPAVCVTRKGERFVQPLSEEEQKLLESPLNLNNPSGTVKNTK